MTSRARSREGWDYGAYEFPAIELIDVQYEIGGARVLRGVNFGVEPGRITALIGPSGAGKTSCLRIVVGLQAPDRGDVLVEGRSTLAMKKAERMRLSRRFGVLLQGAGVYGSALWDSMTVEENLIHQLRSLTDLDDEQILLRARERLAEVGLAARAELYPNVLSAGMRRRLALARAFAADPDFAVLDSFEMGQDPVTRNHLCDVIVRRRAATGGTVLLATQSMEVMRRIADDAIFIWNGRVMMQGPAEEILEANEPEIRQLLSGSTDGPLTMAPDAYEQWRLQRQARVTPGEVGFELPAPLIGVGLMAAITASALWLGGSDPVELAVIALLWVVMAALIARWVRSR